jgi:hypothetical protein
MAFIAAVAATIFASRRQAGMRYLIQMVHPATFQRHRNARMKRHFNSLLRRKRAEFDDGMDMRQSAQFKVPNEAAIIQTRDGYDWLALIKQTQAVRAPARG